MPLIRSSSSEDARVDVDLARFASRRFDLNWCRTGASSSSSASVSSSTSESALRGRSSLSSSLSLSELTSSMSRFVMRTFDRFGRVALSATSSSSELACLRLRGDGEDAAAGVPFCLLRFAVRKSSFALLFIPLVSCS